MRELEKYVTIALLTRHELEGVGNSLRLVVPTERLPDEFEELLAKIDKADKQQAGHCACVHN